MFGCELRFEFLIAALLKRIDPISDQSACFISFCAG